MNHYLANLILLILISSGCGSSKNIQSEVVEGVQNNKDSDYSIGKVHLNDEDCEIFILTESQNQEKLYPVGLDKLFHVNGAVLQFEYDYSRAPIPNGCEDSRAVVLRNITRLKR